MGQMTRRATVCDNLFIGLAFWTILNTSKALAGEAASGSGTVPKADADGVRELRALSAPMLRMPSSSSATALALNSDGLHESRSVSASMLRIPSPYRPVEPVDSRQTATRIFGTHVQALPRHDGSSSIADGEPLIGDTSVWQRLSEYRSHNRVRVVTLWETGGNSLSLQAGKRGDPSLQWISRFMDRGMPGRGVLDELFSTSLGHDLGKTLHLSSHNSGSDSGARSFLPAERESATAAMPLGSAAH